MGILPICLVLSRTSIRRGTLREGLQTSYCRCHLNHISVDLIHAAPRFVGLVLTQEESFRFLLPSAKEKTCPLFPLILCQALRSRPAFRSQHHSVSSISSCTRRLRPLTRISLPFAEKSGACQPALRAYP